MMLIYILLLLPVPLILDFQLNLTSWSVYKNAVAFTRQSAIADHSHYIYEWQLAGADADVELPPSKTRE